ncbi:MAG: hypothetical protein D6722_05950 [Bacteroidetes bacterium]|nr:MAG: hypothetical protein D6722_05950 [Bacteroidota bacterium]
MICEKICDCFPVIFHLTEHWFRGDHGGKPDDCATPVLPARAYALSGLCLRPLPLFFVIDPAF